MLVRATPMEGTGVLLPLNPADDLLVARGVTLRALDDYAVFCGNFTAGVAEDVNIRIDGALFTASNSETCLSVQGLQTEDHVSLFIGQTGLVAGYGGISLGAAAGSDLVADIVNQGTIQGAFIGITSSVSLTRITNNGRIFSDNVAIFLSDSAGDSRLILNNSGQIVGSIACEDGRDVIRNTGRITALYLSAGDDAYLGHLGRTSGPLFGGDGNDRFTLGAGRETVDGGAGVDTVDFRGGAAVALDLANMAQSTGRARGDSYTAIEIFQGSGYGDILRGGTGDDIFYANGGNDRLSGRSGIDFLSGGAGRDTLTGGAGDDTFYFRAPGDRADLITDFSNDAGANNNDTIAILAQGFGAGLASGALNPAKFRSGGSNLARDRDDRFIFRQGDATLWFDPDGSGRKAAVLIADLQAGSLLTAADIVLY